MQLADLMALEYPRHVHKPAGLYLRVDNAVECADALDAGWSLDVPVAVPAVADAVADAVAEPVADAEPKAKGKGKR